MSSDLDGFGLEHDKLTLVCHEHPNVTVDVIPVVIYTDRPGSWVARKAEELGIDTPEFDLPALVVPDVTDALKGRSVEHVVNETLPPDWWARRTLAQDEAFHEAGGRSRTRRTWTCPACLISDDGAPVVKVDLTADVFSKVLTVLIGAGVSEAGSAGVSKVHLKTLNEIAFRLSVP